MGKKSTKKDSITGPVFNLLKDLFNYGKDTVNQAEEETEKFIRAVMDKAQATEDEAEKVLKEFILRLQDNRRIMMTQLESGMQNFFQMMKLASQDEVHRMQNEVEGMTDRIDRIIERLERDGKEV